MSFIGNGMVNCAMGDFSFIGNGTGNEVVTGNSHSAIGGGVGNRISAACGTIGGGQSNCIMPGAAHSGIFSGCSNIVSGQCSIIFGGSGNNDNGLPYVGIFGCNINNPLNMSPNTFHVECLNAIGTPIGPGTLVPGSVFYAPYTGAIPIGAKVLYIV